MNRFDTQEVSVLVARETLGRRGGTTNVASVWANNQSAVVNVGFFNAGASTAVQVIYVSQG